MILFAMGQGKSKAPCAFTTSGTAGAVRLIVRIACVGRGMSWSMIPRRTVWLTYLACSMTASQANSASAVSLTK